jgi:transglutaminase-like putative cysteine protease
MQLLTVRHLTTYRYRRPVSFGEHRMMLRPRDSYDQRLIEARLDIAPEPAELRWMHDVFGNCVAIARSNALEFQLEDYARTYPFSYSAEEGPDLLRMIERLYLDPERVVDRWARQFLHDEGPTGTRDLLEAMTHAVHERFIYLRREEPGTQDPTETLQLGSGSCRDFALLMMEAVRALGLAARFVSGYLYVPARDGRRVGGGATHAWLEVYLPGAGWVEFDPTNGIIGNRDLIRVAVVRDPRQAVPLTGTWTGDPSDLIGMDVEVRVTSNGHSPG